MTDKVSTPLAKDSQCFAPTRASVQRFLQIMDYTPPSWPKPIALEQSLKTWIGSWNLPSLSLASPAYIDEIVSAAAAMGAMAYHCRSQAIQERAAQFTFFMIYLDDRIEPDTDVSAYRSFVQRFLGHQDQLDPLLNHFAEHLRSVWNDYDAISANAIVGSAFEFINGCLLEASIDSWPQPRLHPSARSFPYFLRSKVGVAQAYAFLLFDRSAQPKLYTFMQAMPCLMKYIDLVNDILSFWKEELHGENGNYIHHQALVQAKSAQEVLNDLVEESLALRDEIDTVLGRAPDALYAWLSFRQGYITFHLSQPRYKLDDLDLGILNG